MRYAEGNYNVNLFWKVRFYKLQDKNDVQFFILNILDFLVEFKYMIIFLKLIKFNTVMRLNPIEEFNVLNLKNSNLILS